MLVRGFHHGESVFHGVRHRLLAVNVFAGGACVFENVTVLVVHGGNQDRVNVLAVENLAVVADGLDVRVLYGFLRGGVAAVVKIADRDALNAGNIE